MADIDLTGWDDFINKAGGLPESLKEEFAGEVKDAADNWEKLAKIAAPSDQGFLRRNIKAEFINDLEWDISVGQEYAPFIEFGTKSRVSVPAGLEGYAEEFKSNGKGGTKDQAKVMIYAWMDRVGIPKDKQWAVFISIMVHGIRPQPFLFPQRDIVEPEFLDHLQNIVNTEH